VTKHVAYKILTTPQFAALQEGVFEGAPVDIADGYIHLSDATQLTETVSRHFAGQDGLVVLAVDLGRLDIRWEVSRGGQLFPHLYGALRMEDVLAHAPLCWHEGAVVPPGLQRGG
jgi:uncharacterized protein (DUF952 family)